MNLINWIKNITTRSSASDVVPKENMHMDKTQNVSKKRKIVTVILAVLVFGIAVFIPSYLIAQNTRNDVEQIAVVQNLLTHLSNMYVDQVDSEVLIRGALNGIISALEDPYSALLSDSELMRLKGMVVGSFGGLGMYVGKQRDSESPCGTSSRYVEIISTIIDTPAERKGLRSGDLIVDVDGESTADMTLNEAVALLRGKIGTTVGLNIQRGKTDLFAVTLTRAKIEVPTVGYDMISDEVGYIRIFVFTTFTGDKIEEGLKDLADRGMKSLIVDLRNNGGGSLDGAIRAVNPFFVNKLIVSVQGRDEIDRVDHFANRAHLVDEDLPIIILINGASASASEIFAGAFKDYDRAKLLGTTTYGKGSVQQVIHFEDYAMRLTTARYYTPAGKNIDSIGIEPHIVLEDPTLTDNEEKAYIEFINNDVLADFISEGIFSPVNIENFISRIMNDFPDMNEAYLRHRVSQEVYRSTQSKIRLHDLDYDTTLQAALHLLQS